MGGGHCTHHTVPSKTLMFALFRAVITAHPFICPSKLSSRCVSTDNLGSVFHLRCASKIHFPFLRQSKFMLHDLDSCGKKFNYIKSGGGGGVVPFCLFVCGCLFVLNAKMFQSYIS